MDMELKQQLIEKLKSGQCNGRSVFAPLEDGLFTEDDPEFDAVVDICVRTLPPVYVQSLIRKNIVKPSSRNWWNAVGKAVCDQPHFAVWLINTMDLDGNPLWYCVESACKDSQCAFQVLTSGKLPKNSWMFCTVATSAVCRSQSYFERVLQLFPELLDEPNFRGNLLYTFSTFPDALFTCISTGMIGLKNPIFKECIVRLAKSRSYGREALQLDVVRNNPEIYKLFVQTMLNEDTFQYVLPSKVRSDVLNDNTVKSDQKLYKRIIINMFTHWKSYGGFAFEQDN